MWAQTLSTPDVVSRMQVAEEQAGSAGIPYTATREYRLSPADSDKPTSQVLADVNYMPPSQKDYAIRRSEGSDRGTGVIRKVLDHESAMMAHRDRTAITEANYNFALLGSESVAGHRCFVLQLSPKHETSDLLRGKAWVDSQNFLIRRVQGQPAKSPSWWIKNLTVTIDYGQAEGIWTQLATRAAADVRIFGQQVLTSRAIDIRTASESAAAQPHSATPHSTASSRRTYRDAGVWVSQ